MTDDRSAPSRSTVPSVRMVGHRARWARRIVAACATPIILGACVTSSPVNPETTESARRETIASPGEAMAVGDRLAGSSLWALVDGNDPDSDRINLVFAPWGFLDHGAFVDLASQSLSWGGHAYYIDEHGEITNDPLEARDAALGVFAIEPWRSSKDLFNVWYTDLEPETPVGWLNSDERPFALDDVVIVTLAIDAERFNPDLASVAGHDVVFVGPGRPFRPSDGDPFANAVIPIDSEYPAGGLIDVAHELGHAMFNLPDEYVGDRFGFDGRKDLSSWPSCAQDRNEAASWWGDLTGDVDPMLIDWIDEMEDAGFPVGAEDSWREVIEVGAIDGGCYGVAGSARATVDSLMNSGIPVVGSVNRRWAEQVLALWDG